MRVTFAYPHTEDGTEYKPDQVADLDEVTAQRLLQDGKVRLAGDKPAKGKTEKTEG